ncbi:cyanophycinase [Nonomuraea soli]|uniref:Cyanophycinase n=1 Tax=Nonomuraea soli TaxID=1032476 RepID=A0A7W0CFB6_9ACTN|nr:cyanophycinase [Nonomuraea soli]MBA2890103.1 cyanophycinase [Nonomuraea soli]
MRSLVTIVATLACLLTGLPASASTPGALILIGGALSDDNSAVYGEIVARSGGAHARIGVITTASSDPYGTAEDYIALLKQYGAGQAVHVPVTSDAPQKAEDPQLAHMVTGLTGVFFGGGDQWRYVRTLIRPDGSDTAVLAAIRSAYADGAPVAGTSAGLHFLNGPDMVTGGDSYEALRDGAKVGYFDDPAVLGYHPAGGLGLFTAGLLDSHFSARGRQGRAVRLAADTDHDRVFGVDEDTALVVTGSTMRVVGRQGVSVLDLRRATGSGREVSGVRWSYLTSGDRYHAGTWTTRPAPGKLPLVPRAGNAEPVAGVFGEDTLRTLALDLAAARRQLKARGRTEQSSPAFVVELTKAPGFAAFGSDGRVASFAGLRLDIHAG